MAIPHASCPNNPSCPNNQLHAITRQIYAHSSSIFERKEGNWDYLPTENAAENKANHIAHWASVLSKEEGHEWLQRFLQIECIDAPTLDKMLSPVQVNEQTELPDWVAVLDDILLIYSKGNWELKDTSRNRQEENKDFLDAEDPAPFEDILLPIIGYYRQLMDKKLKPYKDVVQANVRRDFEVAFLGLMSKTMGKVLYEEFYAFRQAHLRGNGQHIEAKSRKIYLAFIQFMQAGGFVELLQKYPVLARIISVLTLQLSDANARFINHLVTDYGEIKQHFFQGEILGKAQNVYSSLSDRHNGGDSVVILEFEAGQKLVYKPKNLDLAENYDKLVEWINAQGYQPDFKRFKILNKQDYGWMEYLQFKDCATTDEIETYYLRAGSLLGLAHLLQTTDCHYENVLACGAYPTLVDFETILHPHVLPTFEDNKSSEALQGLYKYMKSVARTCLLPIKMNQQKIGVNIAGFGGVTALKPSPSWRCLLPNTDEMRIDKALYPLEEEVNIPHFEHQPQRLPAYLEVFKQGFQQFYHFLLAHQAVLQGAQSPLNHFKDLPERFLFRNTYVYGHILEKLRSPKFLKDGITYSIQLEMLTKAFLKPVEKPLFWDMIQEEHRAMMEQDIPFYTTTTTTKSLKINEKSEVTDYFEQPSYQSMIDYLAALNQEDLDFQLSIIDACVAEQLEPTINDLAEKAQNTEGVLLKFSKAEIAGQKSKGVTFY